MLHRMLADLDINSNGTSYPSTLRCILLGGGPAPYPLLEACMRRDIPVVQTYGLTESCSQAVTLSPSEAMRKIGSAGRPLLPVQLRILHDNRPASPTSMSSTAAQTLSSPEVRMSTRPRSNPSCDPIPPWKKPASVDKPIPNGARCPLPSSSSNPAARSLPRSYSAIPRKNWLAINSPAPSTLPINSRIHPQENSYAGSYRACYKPCTINEEEEAPQVL